MDRLLLNRLNLQRVELLVENLAKIHGDRFVDLLPEMCAEDLDQRDLQRGNLAVHENAGEVELHLEANVDIGAVDRGRPPEGEPTVGDLVQTGPLRVGQFLVLHRFLKARSLLPEETLPRGEVRPLEQRVLQDTLHAAERLDHVGAVVVEVPQLSIVPLVRPPERIEPEQAVLLEMRPDAPALIVRERVPILLEQSVDAWDAAVPGVLQVLQGQPPVLRLSLLPLEGIFRPDPL